MRSGMHAMHLECNGMYVCMQKRGAVGSLGPALIMPPHVTIAHAWHAGRAMSSDVTDLHEQIRDVEVGRA